MKSDHSPSDTSNDGPAKEQADAISESLLPSPDSLLREATSTPSNILEISTLANVCGMEFVQALPSETDEACSMIEFSKYVKHILTGDHYEQYIATQYFHRLLSIQGSPYIQEVIDAGVVPCCVRFLEKDDQQVGDSTTQNSIKSTLTAFLQNLQLEAAHVLAALVAEASEYTHHVLDTGALPQFLRLLCSSEDNLRDEVAWALGNIAGDCVLCRDRALSAGALLALVQALETYHGASQQTTVRNITWALSNLFRGKPPPVMDVIRPSFPWLSPLLSSDDSETLESTCWALAFISDSYDDEHDVQALFDVDLASRLIHLLRDSSASIQTPALRALGNVISGNDSQTQSIIDLNIVPVLRSLLDHADKGIVKNACWTISNITVGTILQIQTVIDAGIFPKLVELMYLPEWRITEWSTDWSMEAEIQKEAAWAVCNATSRGAVEQIVYLIHNINIIPPFCTLLQVSDTKLVTIALEALENILKATLKIEQCEDVKGLMSGCGGTKWIETLQSHRSNNVRKRVVRILQSFFTSSPEDT